MSSMTFDTSIFDLSIEDFKEIKVDKKQSDFYKPDPKKGDGVVYESIIKFIPFYKDRKKGIIDKWSCWMTDPVTNESRSVDCPSTIGQPSIIQQVFFKLYKSESQRDKDLSEKFSRKRHYYSLIQIIKDKQDPSLEGKIKIFKYGNVIYNKIQNALGGGASVVSKLDDEDDSMDSDKFNPFDLFEGRPFAISVIQKGKWPNYDQCEFIRKPFPILIDGEKIKKSKESIPLITKFLQENSPDLEKMEFVPWDDDTENFVKSCIKGILPPGHPIISALNINTTSSSIKSEYVHDDFADIPVVSKKKIVVESEDDDEDDFIMPSQKNKSLNDIKTKNNIAKKVDLNSLIDDDDDAYSGL